ncbi:MAG: hypothetical protein ACLSG4_20860, partial [Anaerobutyricum sp.]
ESTRFLKVQTSVFVKKQISGANFNKIKKTKSCSIYEYEQDFSIYNNIFYNISFDYPENFSL